MIPRPSWTVVIALLLVLAGIAGSRVPATFGLTAPAATHAGQSAAAGGCPGFALGGSAASCLLIAAVICNPAGTVDPVSGSPAAQDQIRVQGFSSPEQPAELLFTAAGTVLTAGGGRAQKRWTGPAAAGFSLDRGVRPDLNLTSEGAEAPLHLSGSAGCY